MIRVNLAKVSSHDEEVSEAKSSGQALELGDLNKNSLLKVAVIFLFPLAMYFWESKINKDVTAKLKTQQKVLQTLQGEVAQFGAAATAVEDIKKERERLHERLRVIAEISSKRAYKIRTLEAMQRIIPKDCWLKEIKITKNQIELNGYSRSPSSVQSLVEKLSQMDFLSSVTNEGMVRKRLGDTNVSEFSILAQVLEN